MLEDESMTSSKKVEDATEKREYFFKPLSCILLLERQTTSSGGIEDWRYSDANFVSSNLASLCRKLSATLDCERKTLMVKRIIQ